MLLLFWRCEAGHLLLLPEVTLESNTFHFYDLCLRKVTKTFLFLTSCSFVLLMSFPARVQQNTVAGFSVPEAMMLFEDSYLCKFLHSSKSLLKVVRFVCLCSAMPTARDWFLDVSILLYLEKLSPTVISSISQFLLNGYCQMAESLGSVF